MGDSITEGTIETWLVGVGDAVEEDQVCVITLLFSIVRTQSQFPLVTETV